MKKILYRNVPWKRYFLLVTNMLAFNLEILNTVNINVILL